MKFIINKEHFTYGGQDYKKGQKVELPESFDTMTSESLGLINREDKKYKGNRNNEDTGELMQSNPQTRFIEVQEDFREKNQKMLDENHKKAMDEIAKQEELAKQKAK